MILTSLTIIASAEQREVSLISHFNDLLIVFGTSGLLMKGPVKNIDKNMEKVMESSTCIYQEMQPISALTRKIMDAVQSVVDGVVSKICLKNSVVRVIF